MIAMVTNNDIQSINASLISVRNELQIMLENLQAMQKELKEIEKNYAILKANVG